VGEIKEHMCQNKPTHSPKGLLLASDCNRSPQKKSSRRETCRHQQDLIPEGPVQVLPSMAGVQSLMQRTSTQRKGPGSPVGNRSLKSGRREHKWMITEISSLYI